MARQALSGATAHVQKAAHLTRIFPFYGLSLAAGCVDAISFLRFGEVFTANMTGNTVLLGIAIVSRFGSLPTGLKIGPPLLAIVAFVVGACVALPAFRNGFNKRRAALSVLVEAILIALAGVAFATSQSQLAVGLCIGLVGLAMGAQSIVASDAGMPGISTTYVTGTLITAVTRLFSNGPRPERSRDVTRDGLVWSAYLCGAALGALLLILFHRAALFPVAILFVAVAAWVAI